MARYRKRPVVVEAVRYRADTCTEICAWVGIPHEGGFDPEICGISWLAIPTLEGDMRANPGDWIIRGVASEFYPCKPDIFAATYEAVVEVAPQHSHPSQFDVMLVGCPACYPDTQS